METARISNVSLTCFCVFPSIRGGTADAALAGVINIVTREEAEGIRATGSVGMESHQTSDINASIGVAGDRGSIRVRYNRFCTSGYDLAPDVIGLTGPGFLDQSATLQGSKIISDRVSLDLNARYSNVGQSNQIGFQDRDINRSFSEESERTQWSVSPRLKMTTNFGAVVSVRGHISNFETSSLKVVISGRFDHHSDYDSRLKPKGAVLWRATRGLKVRGSTGTGFKAPFFQQMHLDFINSVAGYSAVGATHSIGLSIAFPNICSTSPERTYNISIAVCTCPPMSVPGAKACSVISSSSPP